MVLSTQDNPPLKLPRLWYLLAVFIAKFNQLLILSQGGQLGWSSCLTLAGRVTLASGTTFLEINALAGLTGTTLRNLN